jgi:uncharacterized delta-60 repeat protein
MKKRNWALSFSLIALMMLVTSCGGGGGGRGPGLQAFAKTWGGGSSDYIEAVAVDSDGNIYCTGYTNSFGAGLSDTLLLKYDSSGVLQLAKTWGGSSYDYLYAVALDSNGDIYCAGYTHSFGESVGDTLLLKYDSSGAFQWANTWGSTSYDYLYAVAVDSSGNIYCAGYTESFGAGQRDALLLKYDSSGALQWGNTAKTWGGGNQEQLYAVAVDSSGNIYCAGFTYSFGEGTSDALLLKYDSSGALAWAKTWGNINQQYLRAVAVDSSGNIYCAGYTIVGGVNKALLLKYDDSGTLAWAKTWGGSGWDNLFAVAVDSSGNIYCAGSTTSFGTGGDTLLLKYDSSGALQWAKTWGGSDGDGVSAIAVDSTGNVCLGGVTYSYTGTWQVVTTGIQTSPSGTEDSPTGTEDTPTGTEASPTGTENSPTGDETGASGADTLLLKNW